MATLSKSDVERFHPDGFLGPIRAFSPEAMDQFAEGVATILSGKDGSHHRHLDSRAIYEMCASPEIVGKSSGISGPDIMLWASNFFVKYPGARETPWHQDQNTGVPAVLEPPLNVSVWLAIDEVRAANSCMKFLLAPI